MADSGDDGGSTEEVDELFDKRGVVSMGAVVSAILLSFHLSGGRCDETRGLGRVFQSSVQSENSYGLW